MSFQRFKRVKALYCASGQSNTFVDPFTTDQSKEKKIWCLLTEYHFKRNIQIYACMPATAKFLLPKCQTEF